MKLIVTGAKGMLAGDLLPLLEDYEVRAFTKEELDITDEEAIRAALAEENPHILVNCAAYTNVDGAEDEEEMAYTINARAPGFLAQECKRIGARLVHISTDFVFDGSKPRPYTEEDLPKPLNFYGLSKLDGEREIQKHTDNFVIIRTSWLYGHRGKNFPKTILTRAGELEELRVVYDQVGTPTYTVDLAHAIVELLSAPAGIYNFSNEGVASWYDFAYNIVELAKKEAVALRVKTIRPILSEELNLKATRPHYSVLHKDKYRRYTGLPIPHWLDGLERWLSRELRARKNEGDVR